MTVERFIPPYLLLVISQLEPFFLRIPFPPLTVIGIPPYAFAIVQNSELTAYCFDRAFRAVVFAIFPNEKRVLFKPFLEHFLWEEQVGRDTFARCNRLPLELVGHKLNVSHN